MQHIKFYTGRARQDDHQENHQARRTLELYLIDTYGGFTRYDTYGGWKDNESGDTHTERGYVYEVLSDKHRSSAKLKATANQLKRAFDQKVILYTVELSHKGSLEYGGVGW